MENVAMGAALKAGKYKSASNYFSELDNIIDKNKTAH